MHIGIIFLIVMVAVIASIMAFFNWLEDRGHYGPKSKFCSIVGPLLIVSLGTWSWIASNQKYEVVSTQVVDVDSTPTYAKIQYIDYWNEQVDMKVSGTATQYKVTVYEVWYLGIRYKAYVEIDPVKQRQIIINLEDRPPPPGSPPFPFGPKNGLFEDGDKSACGKCHDGLRQPKLAYSLYDTQDIKRTK